MIASDGAEAAYVHVPFCRHRCGYCNFTVVADRADLVPAYLEALARELAGLGQPRPVKTLFVGGGTPTELAATELAAFLELVVRWFPPRSSDPDAFAEFTVEANPNDLDEETLRVLAGAGVNRLSIGGQSFAAEKLKLLERDHTAEDVLRGVERARRYMDAVALDLIFGVPGETSEGWREDLRRAIELAPDHISTYGLTFERGTQFWSRQLHGDLAEIDEETSRTMYGDAIDTLTAAGYAHYEISNFALPGRRCRHNETYWTGGAYYAVGPGASRHLAGRRETNHRSTATYLKRVLAGESPVAETERLDPRDKARERLVFGLRRMEGVDRAAFARATGYALDDLAGESLPRIVAEGLLEDDGERVRLTREGVYVADAICAEFLRD